MDKSTPSLVLIPPSFDVDQPTFTAHSAKVLIGWVSECEVLVSLSDLCQLFNFLCPLCLSVCLSVCLSLCLSVCSSICLSACRSVYLYVALSVHLSLRLSVCRSVFQSVALSAYLSICLSISSSVYLSVCLSVCLSVYLSLCQKLQAPLGLNLFLLSRPRHLREVPSCFLSLQPIQVHDKKVSYFLFKKLTIFVFFICVKT